MQIVGGESMMPPRQTALIIQCEVGVNIGAEFNHLGRHSSTNKCIYLLQHRKAMMAKPMDLKASTCFNNSCGLSMESLKINASRFYGGQGLRCFSWTYGYFFNDISRILESFVEITNSDLSNDVLILCTEVSNY